MRWLRGLVGLPLLIAAVCGAQLTTGEGVARAEGCLGTFVRGSIEGESNRVKLSLGAQSATCKGSTVDVSSAAPRPFFTHQIACSTDKQQAAAGLCSATPCPDFGQFFAFRTINFPNGTSTPAGFRCVTLGQATAAPGVSAAQVFAAVRRVKLPGGQIGALPASRGLANLPTFFYLRGAAQPPVDLQVSGSTVHAVFRVLEYRWAFGDGQVLVTSGPGSASLDSEVRVAFGRRGRYRVAVTVAWVAEAFLDGRRVGQVDGLASRAQRTYPVAEVRAVLTG